MMAVGTQSTQGRDRFLLMLRHYAKEVPSTRPRPNVIPAASTPKRTWRTPEYRTPRPVSSEMPAPTPNSANAANAALTITPQLPDRKKNGTTGMLAPSANRQNDALAAAHAEPPISFG